MAQNLVSSVALDNFAKKTAGDQSGSFNSLPHNPDFLPP